MLYEWFMELVKNLLTNPIEINMWVIFWVFGILLFTATGINRTHAEMNFEEQPNRIATTVIVIFTIAAPIVAMMVDPTFRPKGFTITSHFYWLLILVILLFSLIGCIRMLVKQRWHVMPLAYLCIFFLVPIIINVLTA